MAGVSIGLTGDWALASNILRTAPVRLRVAIDRAVMQEAQFFRTKVIEGFREQSPGGQPFKPLAETTLAIRRFKGFGGTKALMVRGDLRNSIKVTKKTTALGAEAFIGVHRAEKTKDGKSLVNIAEVQEFGSRPIVIEVTPAMRKFLMKAFTQELGAREPTGDGSGSGTMSTGIIIVQIPARPFLQPVIDKYFNSLEARLRFQGRVMANLGGLLGITGSAHGITGGRSRGGSIFSSISQAISRSRNGLGRDPVTGRFVSRNS